MSLAWSAAIAWAVVLPAQAARLALVVGNDTYAHVSSLTNARNDAQLMARTLEDAGFEVVGGVRTNLDRKSMWFAVDQLQRRMHKGDDVVFYYAGHGVQIRANPMLLPVDIDADSDAQVLRDGINLIDIQDAFKEARFALLIIDACRNNPFPPRPGATRGIGESRGLAPIEPAEGTAILMSASRGQTALDVVPGVTADNGLFTFELVRAIRSPGVDVLTALRQVRDTVEDRAKRADHDQRPALVEEMRGQFVLFEATAPVAVPRLPEAAALNASSTVAPALEAISRQSTTPILGPLNGHTGEVAAVAYSPDGTRIVSGSWDNTLRLWDGRTGRSIGGPLTGHTGFIYAVAFSMDGTRIASASGDKTLRFWDARTGEPIGSPLVGHTDGATSLAFSKDGKLLVSGSWDNTLRLWDVHSGESIGAPFDAGVTTVSSVDISPDGRRLVCAGHDNFARILDLVTGRHLLVLTGHTDQITSVAFSPDGSRIASASWDKTVRLWDARTGQAIGPPLTGPTQAIERVAFSPDGTRIASANGDHNLRLWDARTGKPLSTLCCHGNWVASLAFSPDGKRIVSGGADYALLVWDVHGPDGPHH